MAVELVAVRDASARHLTLPGETRPHFKRVALLADYTLELRYIIVYNSL